MMVAPAPGTMPSTVPSTVLRNSVILIAEKFAQRRELRGDVDLAASFGLSMLQALADPRQHFAEAVHADQHFDQLHAVAQDRDAEGKALGAVDAVDADRRHQ